MTITPALLGAFALASAALAAGLCGVLALSRHARMRRSARTLDHALKERAPAAPAPAAAQRHGLLAAIGRASAAWLDTPFGRVAVAEEDRRLLERCGYLDAHARGRFLAARVAGALAAPLAWLALGHGAAHGARFMLLMFIALSAGFMAPKWFVRRRALARQRAVSAELPMFVDLLRLLQGVGLSLDQSLQVMIQDFGNVLPVMSMELALAQGQFATGRTREQSMKRLSTSYDNEDLAAIVRLIVQVEKHGGAVQEPLRQFGDRLRETRRAMLRERIGKLTVKMTGVMVITLLPALLIITAGPGFIAVVRSLSTLHR
ncbi:type II secretion system protein [Caballeronia pedi]|uniref:Type II secretion system protein n=1 Tax=Caballeronia pedi TaxID=1777141 RepID=A0A157ZE11_9BURK|nr:type II secretion system F family protein [Caballeronia pedi]SAK43728.1 type II secretion system protein [Caballeronia pedi]